MNGDPLELLIRMYRAGVAAANPANCLETHWPEPAPGRTGVIACGKAAVQMAVVACRHYGDGIEGVVIHPDSESRPDDACDGLEWHASSHPVPCERSVRAAQACRRMLSPMPQRPSTA